MPALPTSGVSRSARPTGKREQRLCVPIPVFGCIPAAEAKKPATPTVQQLMQQVMVSDLARYRLLILVQVAAGHPHAACAGEEAVGWLRRRSGRWRRRELSCTWSRRLRGGQRRRDKHGYHHIVNSHSSSSAAIVHDLRLYSLRSAATASSASSTAASSARSTGKASGAERCNARTHLPLGTSMKHTTSLAFVLARVSSRTSLLVSHIKD